MIKVLWHKPFFKLKKLINKIKDKTGILFLLRYLDLIF